MHTPLFFDDLLVGDIFESLSKTITESEIIDFGWRYDPQPFHVSKPEANKSFWRLNSKRVYDRGDYF